MHQQATNSWMRNPDDLANDLISDGEVDASRGWASDAAHPISSSRDPLIRRLPVLKWRLGAWGLPTTSWP